MPIDRSIAYSSNQYNEFNEFEAEIFDLANKFSEELNLDDYLNDVVDSFGLQLTPSTLLMLLLPLAELDQEIKANRILEQEYPLNVARDSISQIIREMKYNPAQYDLEYSGRFNSSEYRRSCTSLIQSWWKNFCNIPPFCRYRREG